MKRLIAFLLLAASAHGADFGDIPAALTLPASNSVRRNAANTAFEAYLPGTGGTPAGSDTWVQYNDGGVFGAEGAFSWNKTLDILTIRTTDAVNSSITDSISIGHNSSGTPIASYGTGISLWGKTSTTNDRVMGRYGAVWQTPTEGVQVSALALYAATASGLTINPVYIWPGGGISTINFADPGAGVIRANGGFRTNNAGTLGSFLQGNGTVFEISGYKLPTTIGSNTFVLTSNGTDAVWAAGGAGGVSSFAAGDLSPVFTTTEPNVAGAVTLSFSLSTAAAHTFLGNETGSTAAPHYVQPNFTDLAGDFALTQTPSLVASSLIGRGSASGAGDWERITVGSGLSLTGTVLAATAGGGGTVTDFSAGDLSPLFTTTEATTTTTPALSFALTNAAATTVFGRAAGTSGAPTFSASPQFTAIGNLTTNGFITTSGGTGTLGVNTSTFLTANQPISLTGDVTGGPAATSISTTIANNAVTYAKMQAVSATSKLLGSSSTTTPVQEITLGSNLSMSGTTVNATIGATGPFPWGGSETGHGDSNYTILNTDKVVYTNAAFTAARTWTLPAASTVAAGYAISIIDRQGTVTTTNLLTIQRSGSDLIYPPNTSFYIMSGAFQGVTLESDGVSKWYAVNVQSGGGTGSSGYFSQMSWTAGVYAGSAYTLPVSVSGTTGKIFRSNGSNVVFSASTYPDQNTAVGKILRGNGTNFLESTATYPDTAGTTGNVLTSDGTNWISSAPAGGSAVFVTRETPTGLINSSNTTYTLAFTPTAGSEEVFLNGLEQQSGAGNDYTISGGTITYLAAPTTGDRLLVSYRH